MFKSNYLVEISKRLNNFSSYIPPLPDTLPQQRNVLLIRAHPVKESYSAALAKAAERGLSSAGHNVRVRSLYYHGKPKECYAGKEFSPVLTCDERKGYMDPILIKDREKGNSNLAVEIVEAIRDLRWCDSVVFVFPTWWFSLPAILKGYIDRVMIPGVAFRMPDASLGEVGGTGLISGLHNITKMGVVTTYGTPWYVTLYCGDSSRSIISNALRPICSPSCPLLYSSLYNMDHTTQKERENFLVHIENIYKKF